MAGPRDETELRAAAAPDSVAAWVVQSNETILEEEEGRAESHEGAPFCMSAETPDPESQSCPFRMLAAAVDAGRDTPNAAGQKHHAIGNAGLSARSLQSTDFVARTVSQASLLSAVDLSRGLQVPRASLAGSAIGAGFSGRMRHRPTVGTVATSAVSKTSVRNVIGRTLLSEGADSLGLTSLNRDEWDESEKLKRGKHLPLLRETIWRIDGTINSRFQHNAGKTPEENMSAFGQDFYQELFAQHPSMHSGVFGNKPTEVLGMKLGTIFAEIVRLLELDCPCDLAAAIAELALQHIEYGLEEEHAKPFKSILLQALRRAVTSRGFVWRSRHSTAWRWALDDVLGLLVESVTAGRPRVQRLNESWMFMCEQLSAEAKEKHAGGLYRFTTRMVNSSMPNRASLEFGRWDQSPLQRDKPAPKSTWGHVVSDAMHANQTHGSPQSPQLAISDPISEGKESTNVHSDEGTMLLAKKSTKRVLKSKWQGAARAVRTIKRMVEKKSRKDTESASSSSDTMSGMEDSGINMWTKKEPIAGHDDYVNGRNLVGQAFVDVFAAQNSWAVKDMNFGGSPSHSAKLGEALELIVTCSTKPQILQHKLRVLALTHVQMGLKPQQIASFGGALFDFLEQILDPYNMWDDDTESAWRWIWDIVHSVFVSHMESAQIMLQHLETSWELIEKEQLGTIIGTRFYQHLFKIAPQLQPMFKKPFRMQLVMLTKALELIVRCVRDTHVLDTELKALAMRHIRFDISHVHLSIFGDVLMMTLQDVMGPELLTEEMGESWSNVYMHIAGVFAQVLSSGRNLVSKALADGNIDGLKKALQAMPRGKRTRSALEIEVEDNIVSPIVWSIHDGQMALAEILLKDVLAIRGDRDRYYYGRSMLWEKHPYLIRLLVDKAPSLIPAVLDGHMWTSRFIENGKRRVNFYIAELYGNPEGTENRNVYNTMLGIAVTKLNPSELQVFAHPVVNFLVELKWNLFAKKQFLISQALNWSNLALSTAYLQVGADHPRASFVLGLLQLLVGASKILFYGQTVAKQLKNRSGGIRVIFGRRVLVPYAAFDVFVILHIVSAGMCVALFACTWEVDPFGWKKALLRNGSAPLDPADSPGGFQAWADLAAFTTGLLWLQMAEGFKATTKLSALLYAFLAVLSDVMRFMVVMGVWVVGFSITLYWLIVGMALERGEPLVDALEPDVVMIEKADVGEMIYFTLLSCLGMTSIDVFVDTSWKIRIVFTVCVMSTVVVLLNLLVSTMVNTYDMLQQNCDELAVKSRAWLVVRAEEQLSLSARTRIYKDLKLDEPLELEANDLGPSGGLQQFLPIENMSHPAYAVLDRLERYSGPTEQDLPWDPTMLQSTSFYTVAEHTSTQNSEANGVRKDLQQQLSALQNDMMNIKQALGIKDNDDGTLTMSASRRSSASDSASRSSADQFSRAERPKISFEFNERPRSSLDSTKAAGPRESTHTMAIRHNQAHAQRKMGVTMEEVAANCTENSLWLLVDGMVYDGTSLLGYHPGGKHVLLQAAGSDMSAAFHGSHMGPSLTAAKATLRSLPLVGPYAQLSLPGEIVPVHDPVHSKAIESQTSVARSTAV